MIRKNVNEVPTLLYASTKSTNADFASEGNNAYQFESSLDGTKIKDFFNEVFYVESKANMVVTRTTGIKIGSQKSKNYNLSSNSLTLNMTSYLPTAMMTIL